MSGVAVSVQVSVSRCDVSTLEGECGGSHGG